ELIQGAVAAGARHLTLEVRSRNTAARSLYSSVGLAPVGVRPGYYGDDDALILWAHDIDHPEYLSDLGDEFASLTPPSPAEAADGPPTSGGTNPGSLTSRSPAEAADGPPTSGGTNPGLLTSRSPAEAADGPPTSGGKNPDTGGQT